MFPVFFNRLNGKAYRQSGNKLTFEGEKAEIINNIPRFVDSSSYASLFGEQWKEYKKTQFDSYTVSPTSESRLNCCLGEELKNNLTGKLI